MEREREREREREWERERERENIFAYLMIIVLLLHKTLNNSNQLHCKFFNWTFKDLFHLCFSFKVLSAFFFYGSVVGFILLIFKKFNQALSVMTEIFIKKFSHNLPFSLSTLSIYFPFLFPLSFSLATLLSLPTLSLCLAFSNFSLSL